MKKVCLGLGAAVCVIVLIFTVSSWEHANPEETPAEPTVHSDEPPKIAENDQQYEQWEEEL